MERKVKYDVAFKLKCVKEVLIDCTSVNSISRREGFKKSLLRKWISEYQLKGIDGLIPKHKNNKYSQSFKYNVLSGPKGNTQGMNKLLLFCNLVL